MTVATVDSLVTDVMLVAKGHRLGARNSHFSDVGGAIDCPEKQRQHDHQKDAAKNGDLGDRVRAGMKYLRHQPYDLDRRCYPTMFGITF